jgi:hypothetical protein
VDKKPSFRAGKLRRHTHKPHVVIDHDDVIRHQAFMKSFKLVGIENQAAA